MASGLAAMIVVSSTTVSAMPVAEMEKAYWDCEFAAVEGHISLDSAAACSEIYEHLKKRKFGGQFTNFLLWWQENKTHELSLRSAQGQFRD